MKVLLAGASGTIGSAVARELRRAGYDLVLPVREGTGLPEGLGRTLPVDFMQPESLSNALKGQQIDSVISCMTTRSGAPADAWAVEHGAQLNLMRAAKRAGAQHFLLLSAICVQKPRLAFQYAKLAFEADLKESGLDWTIIRPTAFFKSLSGQLARVQQGKPFLVFGDGRQTACKPISDADLARFIVHCLTDPTAKGAILPIGGPGPAITPMDQAEKLFELMGEPARIRQVPVALMDVIAGGFGLLAPLHKRFAEKAEFARTGRYYATESMLLWDPAAQRYDSEATPEFGTMTLWDHYADVLAGRTKTDLRAHAMF